ncbi:MAG: putative sugar nucleotidyl transferase [candidate division WOR-3 bacterium]
MKIVLFEDEKFTNFYPITRLHSLTEIRTGKYTQKEKVFFQFNIRPLIFSPRKSYRDEFKVDDDTLFLNARLKDFRFFKELEKGVCIINKEGEILGYRGEKFISKKKDFKGYKVIEKELPTFNFIWDIIRDLTESLYSDFKDSARFLGKLESPIGKFVFLRNRRNIYVGKDVKLREGVVLDAEEGPIWIEEKTELESYTFVKGPSYIGRKTKTKPGTILDKVAVGDVVKLGGEIEESIFQGYSNKQHSGFLGHSFIGEWVNLGAGTTNSDLKNNYGEVTVILKEKKYQTGMQFLGVMIGDHSKTAINTSFNTGTIIEPFCNIFGRTFPPKYLPPFSWWSGEIEEYKLDKAIETASKVMNRRNIKLDEKYRKRIKELFLETRKERKTKKY